MAVPMPHEAVRELCSLKEMRASLRAHGTALQHPQPLTLTLQAKFCCSNGAWEIYHQN